MKERSLGQKDKRTSYLGKCPFTRHPGQNSSSLELGFLYQRKMHCLSSCFNFQFLYSLEKKILLSANFGGNLIVWCKPSKFPLSWMSICLGRKGEKREFTFTLLNISIFCSIIWMQDSSGKQLREQELTHTVENLLRCLDAMREKVRRNRISAP